jgi:hypothetical protein
MVAAQRAQQLGQREGDHEVVHRKPVVQFGSYPLGGIGRSAPGAEPVVAAVPSEVLAAAVFAAIAPPAHRLGAAQEDGLQGEALLNGSKRRLLQG